MYAPGVYVVTITGTASKSENAAKKTRTATFQITLDDPCDPPVSLAKPSFENQEYTITDDSAEPYTHPEFTVSPSYCPIKYEYGWTMLANGDSAITQDSVDEKKFTFFYNTSLDPLSESQTVTVTVSTDSLYPTSTTQKVTKIQKFTLTFKNPCFDSDFVEIVAPALSKYDYIVFSQPA